MHHWLNPFSPELKNFEQKNIEYVKYAYFIDQNKGQL